MRALELFCGIGGFAVAVGPLARIVGAIDLSAHVLDVYRHNLPSHPTRQICVTRHDAADFAAYRADLWWMSPPCQPYTVRGLRQDLDDPRAAGLIHLLKILQELGDAGPHTLAMENVEGFLDSRARELTLKTLDDAGYSHRVERCLCPTELGVPARRARYYLVASRAPLAALPTISPTPRRLADYLDEAFAPSLLIDDEDLARHGPGMRLLDVDDPTTHANCFTSAYGKTFRCAGGYVALPGGYARRFSPEEILRLMHFPDWYTFPPHVTERMRYKHIGNSLSIAAMRHILASIPSFESLADQP
jgi:site-specific DNA-cytosine methylase